MDLNKKKFLNIFCLTLIFLGLIIAWLAFGERGFIHLYQMQKERQVYLERIRQLEKANQELLEQIEKLRNDEKYIESQVRKELGLIKENEVIYRFGTEQDKTEQGLSEENSGDEEIAENQNPESDKK